ncbi:MAG: hypothetical protein ICV62_06530 [Cyanobacteria bacterium Co-bin13]|nr:hypothetical protein [Cyanobacteria bacterium Co-bin13]
MNRRNKMLGLAIVGATVLGASPAMAQILEIGDQIQLDLGEDRQPEVRPSISMDGNQLNIQLEEQPRPETRFRINDGGVEIRQEQPAPRERLNLTVPIGEE